MLFQGTDPEKDRKYLWQPSCSKLFVIQVVALRCRFAKKPQYTKAWSFGIETCYGFSKGSLCKCPETEFCSFADRIQQHIILVERNCHWSLTDGDWEDWVQEEGGDKRRKTHTKDGSNNRSNSQENVDICNYNLQCFFSKTFVVVVVVAVVVQS